MHQRFLERRSAIATHRREAVVRDLAAVASGVEIAGHFPPEVTQALRQLTAALQDCSGDERGTYDRLRLLAATFPILDHVMREMAEHYQRASAKLLESITTIGVQAGRAELDGE